MHTFGSMLLVIHIARQTNNTKRKKKKEKEEK